MKNQRTLIKKGRPSKDAIPPVPFGRKLDCIEKMRSRGQIMEIMQINPSSYALYKNGKREPYKSSFEELHKQLGIDLNWLIVDEDVRPGPILVQGLGVEKTSEIAAVSEIGQAKRDTSSPDAKTVPLLERALNLAEQYARELATQLNRSNDRGDKLEAQNTHLLDQNMKLQAALMAAQGGDGSKKRGVGA